MRSLLKLLSSSRTPTSTQCWKRKVSRRTKPTSRPSKQAHASPASQCRVRHAITGPHYFNLPPKTPSIPADIPPTPPFLTCLIPVSLSYHCSSRPPHPNSPEIPSHSIHLNNTSHPPLFFISPQRSTRCQRKPKQKRSGVDTPAMQCNALHCTAHTPVSKPHTHLHIHTCMHVSLRGSCRQ